MRNRKKGTITVFRADTLGTFCPRRVDVPVRGMRRAVRRLRKFGAVAYRSLETEGYASGMMWRNGFGWIAPWSGERHALPVTRTGKTIHV